MYYKETTESNEIAEQLYSFYGVKEITSKAQFKNGTRMFETPNGEWFGVYQSGMVRRIVKNRRGKTISCYQLNKQYKVSNRSTYLGDDKVLYTLQYTNVSRALIHGEEARMIYLRNFLVKNYVKPVVKEFITVNGVKYQKCEQ